MKFVLIGHPVAHSLSPVMHRAAYAALGSEASYQAVDCADEAAVATQVSLLRSGVVHGANVTVPWKRVALALADELDASAAETGAGNVLLARRSAEQVHVVAFNTDAAALVRELSGLMGVTPGAPSQEALPTSRVALILGAGGAALAAAVACRQLGFASVTVSARRWTQRLDPRAWPEVDAFTRLGATAVAWQAVESTCLGADWRHAGQRLVVQATSAGMQHMPGGEQVAALVPWAKLSQPTFAYDVVYTPRVTPFLQAAAAARVAHAGGLGMLVAQAEAAVQLWLGARPPEGVMLRAALVGLDERARAEAPS